VLVKLLKSLLENDHSNLKLPELSCLKLTLGSCSSKGTYIRSLAYDFGQTMNSGSHLTALEEQKLVITM
jgi:tRNA pseudouridine55 synthase